MPTYAIGDVQGCHRTLLRLVDQLRFDPAVDRLWLVGDLVNRGPRSLEALRWARNLSGSLTLVLGNHDLHLLGRALGLRRPRRGDTLDAILAAPDARELLGWLAQRPILHREQGHVLVHAGLHPRWTLAEAESLAREIERRLRDGHASMLLRGFSDRTLPPWSSSLTPAAVLGTALQTMVLLRTCAPSGRRCPSYSGPPEQAPPGCLPWFDAPERPTADLTVVCGHWSALGLRVRSDLIALDTGCVWGGPLTAVRLEDRALFQQPHSE